jgi:hypothetical protein
MNKAKAKQVVVITGDVTMDRSLAGPLCWLLKSSAQIFEAKQREAVDNPELYTI